MNRLNEFLIDFHYDLEENEFNVFPISQKELKEMLVNNEIETCFPMICSEKSDDTDIYVDIDDSLFLNNEDYNNDWLYICKNDEIIALICVHDKNETVCIDAFEINTLYRNKGYAKDILNIFEICVNKNDYDYISLASFDTNSSYFWEHMGFKDIGNLFLKEL